MQIHDDFCEKHINDTDSSSIFAIGTALPSLMADTGMMRTRSSAIARSRLSGDQAKADSKTLAAPESNGDREVNGALPEAIPPEDNMDSRTESALILEKKGPSASDDDSNAHDSNYGALENEFIGLRFATSAAVTVARCTGSEPK